MKCEIMIDFTDHSGVHNKMFLSVHSTAQLGLWWFGKSKLCLGSRGVASDKNFGCAISVSFKVIQFRQMGAIPLFLESVSLTHCICQLDSIWTLEKISF